MANKQIKLTDVKPGLQVVVSEAIGTQVYKIREVARGGSVVHLEYPLDTPDKKMVSGGWMDYSVCRVPNKAQLANA